MEKEKTNYENISDNELVKKVREGDVDKYAEIVGRYRGKLFAYLYRLVRSREEAEYLLQSVFVKTYRNLASFDVDRKFSSWIYRIAHNEAVNYIKRHSLKKFISWEDITATKDRLEISSAEENAEDSLIRKEESWEVEEAIKRLPLKYKQVLTLRYYMDKSYEEISEISGKPINTVGTLINRAKKKLFSELKKLKKN